MTARPPTQCPKCGDHTFDGPLFQSRAVPEDTHALDWVNAATGAQGTVRLPGGRLRWLCNVCRYAVYTLPEDVVRQ